VTGSGQFSQARLYLDEDVPHTTAVLGIALGLDVVAAKDAQPSLPQDDPVHLAAAARDRRIMVTCNRDDYLIATRAAFTSSSPHAGLLILTRRLPRDPERIAHAIERWVKERRARGGWPMQEYEVDSLSQ
jgi:hypothetical protein